MDKWKRVIAYQVVDMHRPGWRGAWDHLVALVSGRDQQTVPTPITFSAWVKSEGEVTLKIEQGQIEAGALLLDRVAEAKTGEDLKDILDETGVVRAAIWEDDREAFKKAFRAAEDKISAANNGASNGV